MLYCNSCGQEADQGALYCTKCGKPIGVMEAKVRVNTEKLNIKEKTSLQCFTKCKWAIVISSVLIITFFIFLLVKDSESARQQQSVNQSSSFSEPVKQNNSVQQQTPSDLAPHHRELKYENFGGLYAAKIKTKTEGDVYLLKDFQEKLDRNSIAFVTVIIPSNQMNVKTVTQKFVYQQGDGYATRITSEIKFTDNSIDRSYEQKRVNIGTDSALEMAIAEVSTNLNKDKETKGVATLGDIRKKYQVSKMWYGGEGCFYAYIKDIDSTFQVVIPLGFGIYVKDYKTNPYALPDRVKVNDVIKGNEYPGDARVQELMKY